MLTSIRTVEYENKLITKDQLANWYSQVDGKEISDFVDALMTHELAIDCNNILTEFNSPFDLQMLEDT